MGPLGVVVSEPEVEIGLRGLDAVVEGLAHFHAEELIQHRSVESLDETVGLGAADLGAAVLDAVEVEVELVGVLVGSAELPAVVGQHGFDRQIEGAERTKKRFPSCSTSVRVSESRSASIAGHDALNPRAAMRRSNSLFMTSARNEHKTWPRMVSWSLWKIGRVARRCLAVRKVCSTAHNCL